MDRARGLGKKGGRWIVSNEAELAGKAPLKIAREGATKVQGLIASVCRVRD